MLMLTYIRDHYPSDQIIHYLRMIVIHILEVPTFCDTTFTVKRLRFVLIYLYLKPVLNK